MAVFARTNTFVSGTSITASGHNTNWDDLTTWLNNRYNGTDTWSFIKVSSTTGNCVDVASSASTTELSINNTATDGDPELTFKLSGSQTHIIGVDDSDSDFLKFATTSITTNVAMQIPSTGSQVLFANGTVLLPSIATFTNPTTGFYRSGSDDLSVSNGAGITCTFTAGHTMVISDGAAASPAFSFLNDTDCGIWRVTTNTTGIANGGNESARFDTSVTATHTRMLVYDVDKGAVSRVTVGVNDSGGAGFKLLRVPN